MLIRNDQYEALETDREREFLIGALADFRVIFESVYGRPCRLAIDQQWAIAEYVLDALEDEYTHPGDDALPQVLHRLLRAAEFGVPGPLLHESLAVFVRCLPSSEAGLILMDATLDPGDRT